MKMYSKFLLPWFIFRRKTVPWFIFRRKTVPWFILLITLLFFYKAFLGLIPLPADLITGAYYPWLDYKWGNSVGVPVKNSLPTDAVSIIYPLRSYASDLIKQGQLPLWNPLMFTGYPLIASQPLGLYFPTFVYYLIFSKQLAWTLQIISQVLIASFSMYFLARHLALSKLSSLFSSISFGFGGFSLIWLEWNTQSTASALLPLLILLEDKLIVTKKIKWVSPLALAFTLQLFSGYFPVTIFSVLAMFIWFLFRKSVKGTFLLFLSLALGVGLGGVLLLPAFELFQNSQRLFEVLDKPDAFTPFIYLINLLIPDFFGNPATANFWAPGNYLNVALYCGVLTIVLAMVATYLTSRQKLTLTLLAIFVITMLVTLDNPLSRFLYEMGVWGGSSMTMNRSFFLINFSLGLLAGIGLEKMNHKLVKSYLISTLVIGFALLISFLASFSLRSMEPNLMISFKNIILPLVLVFATLILFLAYKIFNISESFVQLGLVVLLTLELFRFGWKFNSFTPEKYIYPPTDLTDFLIKHPNSRFVSETTILPPNMWVPYMLESPSGYDSVYPLNIAKLIAVINSHDVTASPQTKNGVITSYTSPMLRITGTRFIIVPKRDKQDIKKTGSIEPKLQNPNFKKVFESGSIVVLENTNYLPRAYLTSKVIKQNQQDTLLTLMDEGFLPLEKTLSEDFEIDNQSNQKIRQIPSYKAIANNHVQVITDSDIDSMLVVLNNFYPGWEAKIDSVPTRIHRVNYSFNGVYVPKGKHIIDFYYIPKALIYGALISLLSGCILIFILVSKFTNINFGNIQYR
ncbi:YfhO family protein [Candidatus Daviesbacteria bacterium]|nr:YfhO family protein [Candidatus Daviesbacteria bacterium]